DIGDEKTLFTIGKPGILWKLDRRTGQFLGYKETVFQNVFDSIDPKSGVPTYRADIIEQETGRWVQSCPSTQGGHNWPSMSYHPGAGLFVIPLSQSGMESSGGKGGMGSTGRMVGTRGGERREYAVRLRSRVR